MGWGEGADLSWQVFTEHPDTVPCATPLVLTAASGSFLACIKAPAVGVVALCRDLVSLRSHIVKLAP
jgi:hypothetical protein